MTMFNNGKLPLNKMQKLQQSASRGVGPIEHDNQNDRALAIAYQDGMEEAGMSLFESYMDIVSFIYRNPQRAQFKKSAKVNINWTAEEKEDLFQEIALHFFTLIGEYDPDLGDFQGIIKGKLHLRVYDNFFEDVVSQKFNEVEFEDGLDFEGKPGSIFLEGSHTEKLPEQYIELYNAMNQLTPKQRKVVELSVCKGWSAPEIGVELVMNNDAVRQQLKRGLDKLKELMVK